MKHDDHLIMETWESGKRPSWMNQVPVDEFIQILHKLYGEAKVSAVLSGHWKQKSHAEMMRVMDDWRDGDYIDLYRLFPNFTEDFKKLKNV